MRRKNRKGFTIVELVIVIAVIGVLAAILVPTFVNLTKDAHRASDKSFIHNVNTQLAIEEIDPKKGKAETMYDAIQVAKERGLDIERLTPYDGNDIIWDSVANRFALVAADLDPSNPNADPAKIIYSDGDLKGKNHELWKCYSAMPTAPYTYSIYAKYDWNMTVKDIGPLTVGFDAGDVMGLTKVTFAKEDTAKTQYTFRTNAGMDIEFTDAFGEPKFFGEAADVKLNKVYEQSGHFRGNVKSLELNGGHAVFEKGSVTGFFDPIPDGMPVSYNIKAGATVGTLGGKKGTGEKITGRSESGSKVITFAMVDSGTDAVESADIRLGERPTNWTRTDEGTIADNVYISGVAPQGGETKEPAASCSQHDWKPSADAPVAVCANCGEVKFNKVEVNEETGQPEPVPYVIDVDGTEEELVDRNTTYGFYNSYVAEATAQTPTHWIHEITNKAEFKYILSHIHTNKTEEAESVPLADENTEYRILNDINFGGTLWTAAELVGQETFVGRLVSGKETNVVLSNVELRPTANVIRADWQSAGGLFGLALDASFEKITLSDFVLNGDAAKGCGLFIAGNNAALAYHELSFVDCVVADTCSINASANTGAFVGSTRGISEVSFTRCINSANVICTSTNVGGFIGTGSTASSDSTNSLTFTDCVNAGHIMGTNYVGGFTGNTGNGGRVLTGTGNLNSGNVYVTTTGTNYGMFFSGDSWYKNTSSFSGQMTGRLKVGSTSSCYEKSHLGDFTYSVVDGNEVAITSANYATCVDSYQLVALAPSFNEQNKLLFGNSVDCDRVVVNIRQHGLRISKAEYWPYGDNQQTNEVGGPEQSETYAYMASLSFNSIANVDVTKVTQCGYFIPNGANNPQASYAAGFETFKLDNALYGTSGYEDGYHVSAGGIGYIIAANSDPSADQYLAICDWRNDIQYEVTAYKDGAIVGNGVVNYGRGSGDATYLTAINF